MYNDKLIVFLQKMLEKCHLQSLIVDPAEAVDPKIDMNLNSLFEGRENNETYYDYFPDIKSKTVYRISDIFLCRYIFFELPNMKDKKIFIVGPYLYNDITRSQIMEQGEKMGISPKNAKHLEYYYAALPVVRDENYIYAMINTVAEYLWEDGVFEYTDISLESSAAFMHGQFTEKAGNDGESINISAMEKRYKYENDLMEAVSRGNINKAENMISGFSSIVFENRVPDRLRNLKNYCVIMNTLFRKAAENGGVHPVYLDRMSSDFAKTIEETRSLQEIMKLIPEILRRYCRLVKRHSLKNYSSPVQKAIITIESDLTADLSLRTIAELNNVSPSYFSGLFKKETGHTLTDYVNQKRMSYAMHLLKTTNLQIQTVAQHIGILDMHYFCRLFKKYTGRSPTEYRKSLTFR